MDLAPNWPNFSCLRGSDLSPSKLVNNTLEEDEYEQSLLGSNLPFDFRSR